MNNIVFSNHAKQRMGEKRQAGVEINDVIHNAKKYNGFITYPMRIKARAKSGRKFNFVAKDDKDVRLIITVVGEPRKRRRFNY